MSGTLSGAREARTSFLRRLVSRAAARELSAFVVPGQEIARAHGLDLGAAGLRVAPTPRHANVLLVVGELPEGLREAAAVAYAQMPRPRAVLAVGAEGVSPLPGPDISVDADQDALVSGVAELRRCFAEGAFALEAEDFKATALHSRTEYTCSMHPEVVQDEPGTCPKCGMDLIPRETSESNEEEHADHGGHGHAQHGSMHYDEDGEDPGEDDEGQDHGQHGHAHHDVDAEHSGSDRGAEGGASDETERDGHGNEEQGDDDQGGDGNGEAGGGDHADMNHGTGDRGGHEGMDHGDMGFMSMVEMTQGTPRSSDGLQMEWVETPFGPLFPGLPGGLSLTFTLDGDTVAEGATGSTVGALAWEDLNGPVESFVERFAELDPLAPVSYRLLALRAVESAAGTRVESEVELARVGALERERAASHLNWLASFGYLIGYSWLAERAEELQLALLRADAEVMAGISAEVRKLARRVERTPLLRRKLAGVGKAPDLDGVTGPVARAGGQRTDARMEEETYRSLGFEPVVLDGGDALARLRVRVTETERSLELVERAVAIPGADLRDAVSGSGAATVETPRGTATLAATLEGGEVTVTQLETPSARHVGLVKPVTEQRELGDALAGVASLDLSPWEIAR